jgi:hypothetical protein
VDFGEKRIGDGGAVGVRSGEGVEGRGDIDGSESKSKFVKGEGVPISDKGGGEGVTFSYND